MPRKPRIEYAGAIYHIMSRGNRGEEIFKDDSDRETFLETLGQACNRTGWIIHAYTLIPNHFHILLETPEPNLVLGMRWFQSTYAQRYNRRHRESGHLFQGRYKSLLIDPESGYYFEVVSSYIHLNPARARLFDLNKGKLADYVWSSYRCYVRPSKRPEWLSVNTVFRFFNVEDDRKGRARYRNYMDKRVQDIQRSEDTFNADPDWNSVRNGWYVGHYTFRDTLLDRLDTFRSGKKRDSHSGQEVQLHDERQASLLKAKALKQLGLTDQGLLEQRKGSVEKKVLVWFLHSRTTVPNRWLSEHLYCGHVGNISHYVSEVNTAKDAKTRRLKHKILKSGD